MFSLVLIVESRKDKGSFDWTQTIKKESDDFHHEYFDAAEKRYLACV